MFHLPPRYETQWTGYTWIIVLLPSLGPHFFLHLVSCGWCHWTIYKLNFKSYFVQLHYYVLWWSCQVTVFLSLSTFEYVVMRLQWHCMCLVWLIFLVAMFIFSSFPAHSHIINHLERYGLVMNSSTSMLQGLMMRSRLTPLAPSSRSRTQAQNLKKQEKKRTAWFCSILQYVEDTVNIPGKDIMVAL
jgi:hypothetical protein